MNSEKTCYDCEKCLYIGEGGYICEASNDIVIDDWAPTDDFCSCEGKEFEVIRKEDEGK